MEVVCIFLIHASCIFEFRLGLGSDDHGLRFDDDGFQFDDVVLRSNVVGWYHMHVSRVVEHNVTSLNKLYY